MKGKTLLLAGTAAMMVAVSAAPASASDWWQSTSISGRMYYDLTNLDQTTHTNVGGVVTKTDGAHNGYSFDIKRFYVSIDHTFNKMFSADITTDTEYSSATHHSNIFIKKAYLQAKFAPELTLRIGSADMPWIPFVEGVYGYRYVENTLTDRTHYANSADWGVYALGKFAKGLIGYEIAVINGAGYHNQQIRTNGMDFEGRVNVNWNGFVAAVGGYVGDKGAIHSDPRVHTASRIDGLLAYHANNIRLGVEYFHANNWHSVNTATQTDSDDGYSVFASYQFTPEWGVFGRYDWVTTKVKVPAVEKTTNNYYNAGIAFTPYKMIDFALVYKHTKNKTPWLAAYQTTTNEVGIWGRLRW